MAKEWPWPVVETYVPFKHFVARPVLGLVVHSVVKH